VLKIALKGYEGNVRIEFRMLDGRRARGDLCEGVERVMELLYADDLVIICETEKLLNEEILSFERATQAWCLTISVKKTKILIANSDGESVSEPLVIRGEQLERVKEFVYLGITETEKGGSVTEIERRINLGYYKFNDLKKSIWNQSAISLKTKVQIYRATALSTVLYGAESWTCTDKEYSRLNAFNTKPLRVLTRKQRNEISNDRFYKLTGTEQVEDTIRKYRLRWAGHVRRMDDTRLQKKILLRTVAGRKKSAGKPKKNLVDPSKRTVHGQKWLRTDSAFDISALEYFPVSAIDPKWEFSTIYSRFGSQCIRYGRAELGICCIKFPFRLSMY
jgi:hypothetical protein